MARLLALVAAVLVAGVAGVLSEDNYVSSNAGNPSIVEEPTRVIAVRVFQPRVFGGIMIRGHCGQMLMAHSIPVLARVTFREVQPSNDDSYPDPSEDGAPWSHGEAEGISRSLESFFSLSHPLALYKEDPSELDKWHNARMRTLEAIHSQILQQAFGGENTPQNGIVAQASEAQAADQAYREDVAGDASGAARAEASLEEDSVVASQAAGVLPGMLDNIEWTPLNITGVLLLGVGFALLVVMLLMSLSTLIYGCSEPEPEPLIYVLEDSVETPLLKGGEETTQVEGGVIVNPLSNYEPPKEGKQ